MSWYNMQIEKGQYIYFMQNVWCMHSCLLACLRANVCVYVCVCVCVCVSIHFNRWKLSWFWFYFLNSRNCACFYFNTIKWREKSKTDLTASVLKKRLKTHKRLKEHFLIKWNETKHSNFRGNPLFQAMFCPVSIKKAFFWSLVCFEQ